MENTQLSLKEIAHITKVPFGTLCNWSSQFFETVRVPKKWKDRNQLEFDFDFDEGD